MVQTRRKRKKHALDPNEVFLDSSNLPEFDTHQLEGRIERPISKLSLFLTGGAFLFVFFIFSWKAWDLQIVEGEAMRERSEENRLEHSIVFASRGIIYDKNGERLAWNTPPSFPATSMGWASSTPDAASTTPGTAEDFLSREYLLSSGLAHAVGYVKYPAKDKQGVYYQTEFQGMDGAEKEFNGIISGRNGLKIQEVNALGRVESESVIEAPVAGNDISLSMDAGVQSELYARIRDLANQVNFKGGAGVIMDVESGEILAMTSFPEYTQKDITEGNEDKITAYNQDTRTPFINRVVHGLYAPGSIVKPFMALAALAEGIVSPEKQILSTGSVSIPNPYFPDKPSVFKDWKAHGYVDMRHALAVSSDVYFYTIGGGYGGQEGLGILRIKKYMELFGFGEKTGLGLSGEEKGIIPDPVWKEKTFDGAKWLLGDTYHTVIGQYGMQVTPIQAVRAVSAIATNGMLVTPTLLAASSTPSLPTGVKSSQQARKNISVPEKYFAIVKEGMRLAVLEGTAKGLNAYDVHVAGKTGTAELGASKQFVNSWVIGFFPYEKPKYAFAIVMERGPASNLTGAPYVMRQVLDYMAREKPEYLAGEE